MDAAFEPTAGRMRFLFLLRGGPRLASSRVRGHWIAAALRDLGHVAEILDGEGGAAQVRAAVRLPFVDVLILQKRRSRADLGLIRLARLLGKTVWYDIDDVLRDPMSGRGLQATTLMRCADGVLAGSEALVRWCETFNPVVRLLPTAVRTANYRPIADELRSGAVCLGWIGSGPNYAEDLASLLPGPLRMLAGDRAIRLKLVGACEDARIHSVFSHLDGVDVEIVDAIDWSSPAAVRAAMADFDIGLYPLSPVHFNAYKCGFKALEYMAMGIPVVASDVGANGQIVLDGQTGYVVRDPGEWTDRLGRLIDSPDLRRRLGRDGRARVEARYDVSRVAASLVEICAARPSRAVTSIARGEASP